MTRVRNLFRTIKKNKTLVANFGYMSILQSVNILIPLVTYPYLIRVLSASIYGQIVFAQSLIAFFTIIINFGFEISAVKNVAENQSNKNKLGEIVSSVIFVKLLLFLICLLGLSLFFFINLKFGSNYILYLLTFGICIGDVFFPVWFYQGIEKMKYTTIINVIIKFFFFICIFLFVKKTSDYLIVPILNSLGGIIAGLVSFYILFTVEKIPLKVPTYLNVKKYFIESVPFFASRLSAVILTESNTLLIGTFISMKNVAIYDLAKKIVNMLQIPNSIINTITYPHIVKLKDKKIVGNILKIRFLVALIMYSILLVCSKYFVLFLGGDEMLQSIPITILLGVNLFLTAGSYYLGGSILVAFNYAKYFNLSVIYTLIVYVLLALSLIAFDIVNIYSVVILMLIVEFTILLYRFYYCKKFNLIIF